MRRKPRSLPRQAARAQLLFPPTWLAAAPTFCWAAIPSSWPSRSASRRDWRSPSRWWRGKVRPNPTEPNARHKEVTDAEHEEVVSLGGLFIFGTERHEARRIDNQLRGRAGRQGDPGASRFYLSLEDDLMRIFAKEWVSNLLQRLGMEEGVPIESKLISR